MTAPAELIKANGNGAAIVGGGSALQLLAKQPSPWTKYATILRREFHEPDIDGARAFFSGVAAHKLDGDPVWIFAVAPASSLKTELIRQLRAACSAEIVATCTPQTMISGNIAGDDGSLLNRLGPTPIIAFKDFTSTLKMRPEDRDKVLSDFREIYDGEIRKAYGTGKTREWFGRATIVAGVTPGALERNYGATAALGERFLFVRFRLADAEETAMAAMDESDARERWTRLDNAATDLFNAILPFPAAPTISKAEKRVIAKLAVFVAKARTPLIRDGYKRELEYVSDSENTPRLARQLCQLARGSALLDGRAAINDEDMSLVRRVAFDCVQPTLRMTILRTVAGSNTPMLGSDILKQSGQPLSTGYRTLEDLRWLKLLDKVGGGADADLDSLDDSSSPFELTPLSTVLRSAI